MRLLILLLIPLNVLGQIWMKEIDPRDSNVKRVGEWVHMSQGGSYAETQGSYIEYMFTGIQIEIFTERSPEHEFYIINLDGEDLDTINVKKPFIKNFRTWFKKFDYQGNHVLQIRGDPYEYVIDKFRVITDSNPYYKPSYQDTIIFNTIYKDSIIWNPITRDTIIWKPIYQDTIIKVPVYDSIYNPLFPLDSIYKNSKIYILTPIEELLKND